MTRPRGVRTRLLVTVVVAMAAALALMTGGFNVLLARTLSHDADSVLRIRAATEASSIDLAAGKVVRPGVPDPGGLESQAWVFQRGVAVEQPRVGPALRAAALRLAAKPGATLDVPAARARLYALVSPEVPGVVVVAGISLAPYQQTERVALIASVALAVVLFAVVTLVTRWTLRQALQPVARMTADAAAWSEHDPGRRFAVGEPHDELSQLAATLDRLLDRLSAGLLRERRFSAEVSHELRTPLARVRTEAELALRRERRSGEYRQALRTVVDNATQMAAVVDTLLAAAQQQNGLAHGRSRAGTVLARLAEHCRPLAAACGVSLDVTAPEPELEVAVEADVAIRVLEPLVENACRLATKRVAVGADRTGSDVLFTVIDDGPGVLAGEADAVFEPGRRGSAGDGKPGAGLGLALARRLAQAAGGDVTVTPGAGGRFTARLPCA